jgi:hypothetical protein
MKIIIHPIVLWAEELAINPYLTSKPEFPATEAGYLWDTLPKDLQDDALNRAFSLHRNTLPDSHAPVQSPER